MDAYRAACEKGHGLLSLPCGFGKTVLALAISAHFKLRTMIIVHKEFLAQQWRERIEQFCPGAKVGIVQQNKKEVEGCDYVIAMLQSLSMKEYVFSDFESVGVLIVDECHHICARIVFTGALQSRPSTRLRIISHTRAKGWLDETPHVVYWADGVLCRAEGTARRRGVSNNAQRCTVSNCATGHSEWSAFTRGHDNCAV